MERRGNEYKKRMRFCQFQNAASKWMSPDWGHGNEWVWSNFSTFHASFCQFNWHVMHYLMQKINLGSTSSSRNASALQSLGLGLACSSASWNQTWRKGFGLKLGQKAPKTTAPLYFQIASRGGYFSYVLRGQKRNRRAKIISSAEATILSVATRCHFFHSEVHSSPCLASYCWGNPRKPIITRKTTTTSTGAKVLCFPPMHMLVCTQTLLWC